MAKVVKVTKNGNELGIAVQGVLDDYSESIKHGITLSCREACMRLVDKTRATAPVSKKVNRQHYRDSFTGTPSGSGISWIWHVVNGNYRLTHLLIRDHWNRTRTAMVTGHDFLSPALKTVAKDFNDDVKKLIKEAGRRG